MRLGCTLNFLGHPCVPWLGCPRCLSVWSHHLPGSSQFLFLLVTGPSMRMPWTLAMSLLPTVERRLRPYKPLGTNCVCRWLCRSFLPEAFWLVSSAKSSLTLSHPVSWQRSAWQLWQCRETELLSLGKQEFSPWRVALGHRVHFRGLPSPSRGSPRLCFGPAFGGEEGEARLCSCLF